MLLVLLMWIHLVALFVLVLSVVLVIARKIRLMVLIIVVAKGCHNGAGAIGIENVKSCIVN